MKIFRTATLALGMSAICATSAQAQIGSAFAEESSFQARATVTIPFGQKSRSFRSKPKLALGFRHESVRPGVADWALHPTSDVADIREFELTLTLEDSPTLWLNDQAIITSDRLSADDKGRRQSGLDTYDKTVLTVIAGSLVVIVGAIIVVSD